MTSKIEQGTRQQRFHSECNENPLKFPSSGVTPFLTQVLKESSQSQQRRKPARVEARYMFEDCRFKSGLGITVALPELGAIEIVKMDSILKVMLKGFTNGLDKQHEGKKAVRKDFKGKINLSPLLQAKLILMRITYPDMLRFTDITDTWAEYALLYFSKAINIRETMQ